MRRMRRHCHLSQICRHVIRPAPEVPPSLNPFPPDNPSITNICSLHAGAPSGAVRPLRRAYDPRRPSPHYSQENSLD